MARTKRGASKSATPSEPPATLPTASPTPSSSFPPALRLPALVLLSFALSSGLYTVASPFTSGDLATVSRSPGEVWFAGFLAWKTAQLAFGWYGGFDSSDVAALTFLSNVPYHYFLATFYLIRPSTAAVCLVIDTVSAWMPFWLFKVSSSIHSIETPKGVAANRSVINDFGVQASTSVLAAGIYAVVVLGSYSSWLPTYLVTHFDGIRDISRLHNPNFPALVAAFAPIGFAAKVFIFTPSAAAKHDAYEKEIARFNTESATFSEKIVHDLWGFSHRTRVLIQRVAIVAIVGSLQTWLKSYATIEGAEGYGAAGWASVWALAATVTGAAFAWVIDVEEMSG